MFVPVYDVRGSLRIAVYRGPIEPKEFQRDCSVSGLLSIKQIGCAFGTDGAARTTRGRARSPHS